MSIPPSIKAGDVFKLNSGATVTVIRYESSKRVKILFPAGNTAIVDASNLRSGSIKDPMAPSVYGNGFVGLGPRKPTVNRKRTKAYMAWSEMLKRCYCPDYQAKKPTYIGCVVAPEWLNYQNFAAWYESQPLAKEEGVQLDKDLISPGNKVYGPESCALIPSCVNSLLNDCGGARGKYPIGVTWSKFNKKFVALCSINGKQRHIGYFECPKAAHEAYRDKKESNVRQVAEEMKDLIGDRVYSALMKYKVSCPVYNGLV